LSDKSNKFAKKFAFRWSGPHKVTKVCSDVTYELEIQDSDFLVHNIKNLRLYHDRPSSSDTFHANRLDEKDSAEKLNEDYILLPTAQQSTTVS